MKGVPLSELARRRAEQTRHFIELATYVTPIFVILFFVVVGLWGQWPSTDGDGLAFYGLIGSGLAVCVVGIVLAQARWARRASGR
jgi:hypothetical protein